MASAKSTTFYLVPNMAAVEEKKIKESNSEYVCPDNMVMVGRMHKGDENGDTTYRSAPLMVDPNTGESREIFVVDQTDWIDADPQSKLDYIAPDGWVITGRKHKGDENGETYFKISRVMVAQIYARTVDEVQSGEIKESSGHWYDTPAIDSMKAVITGMTHEGDENGKSTYYGRLVFFPG